MGKEIERLIKKKFGKKYNLLKELTDHGNSFVFLIKSKTENSKFILRIGLIGKSDLSLKNNILALKILKREKNIPKLISFGKLNEYFYSIETFLSGKKREQNVKNLKKLITSFRNIHSYKSKKCGWLSSPQKDWKRYFLKNHVNNYIKRLEKRVKNYQDYINLANNNFPDEKGKLSLLHGDFSFTNSLFDNKKVNFFDFEDSFYGEKEYDLAMIYFMEFLPDKDFVNNFFIKDYDKDKILFYALCIGIRKVALARNKKHALSRLKRLEIVYKNIIKRNKLTLS